MTGQKCSTFPSSIETLDGARRVPTDAELRDQARALGLTVPRSLRERFRADMLRLLNSPRR